MMLGPRRLFRMSVFEYGAKRVGSRGQGRRKGGRGNCKGQAPDRQTIGRQAKTDRHLLISKGGGGALKNQCKKNSGWLTIFVDEAMRG